MALIWRCAAKAAKESMVSRVDIHEVLKTTVSGWEIPPNVEPPEDLTAKELASWVREVARQKS